MQIESVEYVTNMGDWQTDNGERWTPLRRPNDTDETYTFWTFWIFKQCRTVTACACHSFSTLNLREIYKQEPWNRGIVVLSR